MAEGSLSIVFPELNRSIAARRGDNLLALIREANIEIDADCGGVGRCGKCRVIIAGESRLACLVSVVDDMEVFLARSRQDADADYSILTTGALLATGAPDVTHASGTARAPAATRAPDVARTHTPAAATAPEPDARDSLKTDYAIAIDLGTTTIVGKLMAPATGQHLASFATLNAQRPYGADVISRIDAARDDASTLSKLVTEQIDREVRLMLIESGIPAKQVRKVVIAGNTVMSYLLLGLPCRSLGIAPFEPAFKIEGPYPYREIFARDTLSCECEVLPFMSAYVGGDLTSGLYSLRDEDDFILMDMGTNGELLFKRGDRLICTATAAGPAFEGGAIECGSGSTRGAISSVWYEEGDFRYRTIGAAPATGICGSGILDLMAVLVREKLIDETGLFSDSVEDGRVILSEGPVYFSQKDVRQFQLAKSAVRAGVEVLLREMGGAPPAKVFLAGGFGQNLSPTSAIVTGLLPGEFEGRVVGIGNSSLDGAIKLCLDASADANIHALIAQAQEINLATHPLFNDFFMEYMYF